MRRIVATVTTAVAVGFAVHASAADLPFKAPIQQVVTPALTNWSGWYVGANAGYSRGKSTIDYSQDPGLFFGNPPFPAGGSLSSELSPKSFIGGGQLGFNYQTGIWVFGAEADFAWRNRTDSVNYILNTFGDTLTLTDEQKWVGTVRGRIGLSPVPVSNWLFYVTGGLAYGRLEHSFTQSCNGCILPIRTLSDSVTRTGWTLGGGVEVALNGNWSLGAEYLYINLGTETLSAPAAGGPPSTFPATTASFHDTAQVARLKLNYKFGEIGIGTH
jgi:outer membrane immunogenic protein